jgi:hypothetical protein
MGDAELPKESMIDKTNMDFSGPSASSQLLEQMSQDAVMKKGGGMMNMNEMIRPLGYAEGGFENRMAMLRESMRDDENQTMKAPDITGVAIRIAKQQGDTSEDNINLVIKQLESLVPSLMKTMEDQLTPTSTKGIQSLRDTLLEMFGKKSDPVENRNVGFGRVE